MAGKNLKKWTGKIPKKKKNVGKSENTSEIY